MNAGSRVCLIRASMLPSSAAVVALVLHAVAFGDLHAVELERAADEESVAQVPRVVAPFAPDRHVAGAAEVDDLALIQDVLLQFLPVVVPAREHLAHERVEIGLRRDRRDRRRPRGNQKTQHEAGDRRESTRQATYEHGVLPAGRYHYQTFRPVLRFGWS